MEVSSTLNELYVLHTRQSCTCMQTHTHSFVAESHVHWFVHKPMTCHPSYSQHFCSSFSVSFSISEFVASVHLFILSIRKKKPLFLPPGERRRRPRWEITPAQLYSGHAQACLQDKQRCACKDHNHLTPDRV